MYLMEVGLSVKLYVHALEWEFYEGQFPEESEPLQVLGDLMYHHLGVKEERGFLVRSSHFHPALHRLYARSGQYT
jgi:hypothetical protein